jgi:hypothetical protein
MKSINNEGVLHNKGAAVENDAFGKEKMYI